MLLRVETRHGNQKEDKEDKIRPPKGGFLMKVLETIIDRCGETIFLDGR